MGANPRPAGERSTPVELVAGNDVIQPAEPIGAHGVNNFQAVYYRASDGSQPVRDFVDALEVEPRAALLRQIDRLNGLSDTAPHLPFPHSSQVAGELRELRCHMGSDHYRVLYRRSGRLLVLLHVFRKLTGKLPLAEIKIADARWGDFKTRMDSQPRKPPRAAGHDAP